MKFCYSILLWLLPVFIFAQDKPNVLFIAIDDWNNLAENVSYQEEITRLKKFIPGEWADLSSFSKYDINPYFKEKTDDQ